MDENPSYVIINDDTQSKGRRSILRKKAERITFPLSNEDKRLVQILEAKFDGEKDCAGLAAPQIGFSKQMIIFSVPDDPDLKKWRPDLTQSMPKTIWLNPRYDPLSEETHVDYEGCFSVKDLAGPVERFKKINYTANLPNGSTVQGTAEGFLARLIQHEIDHLQGVLFIDQVSDKNLKSMEEYRKMREEKIAASK